MGTQLWEDAKAFIKENGGKNFFFFTDTTCDYKFYEKKDVRGSVPLRRLWI